MSQPPGTAALTRPKRQRLELTEAEERKIRMAMAPYDYRSLHQFVRDVILFLADAPDELGVVMPHIQNWKETKETEEAS